MNAVLHPNVLASFQGNSSVEQSKNIEEGAPNYYEPIKV